MKQKINLIKILSTLFACSLCLLFPSITRAELKEETNKETVPFDYFMDRIAMGDVPDAYAPSTYADLTVKAPGASSKKETITLYAIDSTYEEYLTIPKDKPENYQIRISTDQKVSYRAYGDINVTDKGLVTPIPTIWYKADGYWTTGYIEGAITMTEYSYGEEAYVIADYGDKSVRYDFELVNYARYYAESVMDDYLSDCKKQGLSDYALLEKITAFPARYDYSPNFSGYIGLIIADGGDCWASSSAILYLCEKAGIKAHLRYGVNEPGAGSGHRNVAALVDGTVYICEAGYDGRAPRYYDVTDEGEGYYFHYNDSGFELIQYDGFETDLTLPAKYHNEPVTGIASHAFYYGEAYSGNPIRSVTVPDGVTCLDESAFASSSIEKVSLPASVTSIGTMAFVEMEKLKEVTIDSKNRSYRINSGILYSYDRKKVIEVLGYCNETALQLPDGVETICEYAFVCADKVRAIVFPTSLKSLEIGSVYHCQVDTIYFTGNAPKIDDMAFAYMTLQVFYPESDASYSKSFRTDYYADAITWEPYDAAKPLIKTVLTVPETLTKYIYSKDFTLNTETNSSADLHYTSSRESIAEISTDGKVTINGPGKVTLTVKQEAKGNHLQAEAVCQLTIKTVSLNKCRIYLTKVGKIPGYDIDDHLVLMYKSHVIPLQYYEIFASECSYNQDHYITNVTACAYCYDENYFSGDESISETMLPIRKSSVLSSVSSLSTGNKISWQEESGAYGYILYRKTADGDFEKLTTITDRSTTSYTDQDVKNGKKYSYMVKAYTYNRSGSKVYAKLSSEKTHYYLTRNEITSLKAKAGQKIALSWKENKKAGSYQIQYCSSSSFKNAKTKTVSSATSTTLSGLTAGKTYYVRVRSIKKVGDKKYYGSYSTKASVKVK